MISVKTTEFAIVRDMNNNDGNNNSNNSNNSKSDSGNDNGGDDNDDDGYGIDESGTGTDKKSSKVTRRSVSLMIYTQLIEKFMYSKEMSIFEVRLLLINYTIIYLDLMNEISEKQIIINENDCVKAIGLIIIIKTLMYRLLKIEGLHIAQIIDDLPKNRSVSKKNVSNGVGVGTGTGAAFGAPGVATINEIESTDDVIATATPAVDSDAVVTNANTNTNTITNVNDESTNLLNKNEANGNENENENENDDDDDSEEETEEIGKYISLTDWTMIQDIINFWRVLRKYEKLDLLQLLERRNAESVASKVSASVINVNVNDDSDDSKELAQERHRQRRSLRFSMSGDPNNQILKAIGGQVNDGDDGDDAEEDETKQNGTFLTFRISLRKRFDFLLCFFGFSCVFLFFLFLFGFILDVFLDCIFVAGVIILIDWWFL